MSKKTRLSEANMVKRPPEAQFLHGFKWAFLSQDEQIRACYPSMLLLLAMTIVVD